MNAKTVKFCIEDKSDPEFPDVIEGIFILERINVLTGFIDSSDSIRVTACQYTAYVGDDEKPYFSKIDDKTRKHMEQIARKIHKEQWDDIGSLMEKQEKEREQFEPFTDDYKCAERSFVLTVSCNGTATLAIKPDNDNKMFISDEKNIFDFSNLVLEAFRVAEKEFGGWKD